MVGTADSTDDTQHNSHMYPASIGAVETKFTPVNRHWVGPNISRTRHHNTRISNTYSSFLKLFYEVGDAVNCQDYFPTFLRPVTVA